MFEEGEAEQVDKSARMKQNVSTRIVNKANIRSVK
jgi:hypothetical protein